MIWNKNRIDHHHRHHHLTQNTHTHTVVNESVINRSDLKTKTKIGHFESGKQQQRGNLTSLSNSHTYKQKGTIGQKKTTTTTTRRSQ